jgi:hypothetical protein
VERKIGSGKKCGFSSSKLRAALKKQTAGRSAKSYRELGRKIQVHHKIVKKYLTKMGVHRKAKNCEAKKNYQAEKATPTNFSEFFKKDAIKFQCVGGTSIRKPICLIFCMKFHL